MSIKKQSERRSFSTHPLPRADVTGNKYMTIGIGLVCNQAKNILLCADMRASYGTASSNDQMGKLFDLPRFFCGATAGTTSQCEDVISELYHRMNQITGDDIAPEQVRQCIVDSYHRIYLELSDQALKSDPRITMEQYFHDHALAPEIRQRAEEVLQSIDVDVDLIVAGFREQSPLRRSPELTQVCSPDLSHPKKQVYA